MSLPRCASLLLLGLLVGFGAYGAAQPPKDDKSTLLMKTDTLAASDPFDVRPTANYRKAYEQQMQAGRTYLVTIASGLYTADLRIENAAGQAMALASVGPKSAYALFTPKQTGVYRIVATSQFARLVGPFLLKVLEADGKPFEKNDALSASDPMDLLPVPRYSKRYPHKMEHGQLYVIDMTSPSFEARLRLLDATGAEIAAQAAAGPGQSARLVFAPPRSDTYTIVATSARDNQFGSFTLNVLHLDANNTAAIDKTDTLSSADPVDTVATGSRRKVLEQALVKGRTYVMELASPAFQPFLRLEDENGKPLLLAGGTSNAQLVFTPAESKIFRLIATSRDAEKTGPFTLKVLEAADAGKGLSGAFGAKEPLHRLPTSKHVKRYAWKMDAGKTYIIETAGDTTAKKKAVKKPLAPAFTVEDEIGQVVARADNVTEAERVRLPFTPTQTGTYHILVTTASDHRTGPFTLRILAPEQLVLSKQAELDRQDPLDTQPTRKHFKKYQIKLAQDTGKNDVKIQDKLTKDDLKDPKRGMPAKVHPLKMQTGSTYTIDIGAASMDPYLRLEDATGKKVAEDLSGRFGQARMTFKCTQDGAYKLTCSSLKPLTGTSTYTVTIRKDFQEGQLYDIEMSSAGFGCALYVEDFHGRLLAQEDAGTGTRARLRFSPRTSGFYHVIASSSEPESTGKFSVQVTAVAGPKTAKPAFSQSDALTKDDPYYAVPSPYYVKTFEPKLEAGQTYVVQMQSKDVEPHLRLESAGREVFGEGRGTLIFDCPESATYKIMASSAQQQQTGPFTLTIAAAATLLKKSETLGNADPLLTIPTPDRRKESLQQLEAGTSYLIELQSTDPTAHVYIAGNGTSLSATSRLVYTPSTNGVYRIIATARMPGPFTVQVRPLKTVASQQGALSTADPLDFQPTNRHRKVYTQSLLAKQAYLLSTQSKDFTPLVRVFDARGNAIARNNTASLQGKVAVFTPALSGDYTIVTTALGTVATGTFHTKLQALTPAFTQAAQLTLADPKDALPSGRRSKLISYPMDTEHAYVVEMRSKFYDCALVLHDAQGKELARGISLKGPLPNDRYPARLVAVPAGSATYRISAASAEVGKTGAFQLTVQPFRAIWTKSESLAITDPYDKKPTAKHRKIYALEMQQGKTYTLMMTSGQFDAYLRLEDAAGNELRYHDSGGRNLPARIVFTPQRTEIYKIIATSYDDRNTGAFTLSVTAQQPFFTEAGKLSATDLFDPVRNEQYQKIHLVAMTAGQAHTITLASTDFTPYLRLESSRGKHLRLQPDISRPGQAQISFVPPADETYRIIVTSVEKGATGSYRLSVQK